MESDNRNCQESESESESDDGTSDSTALLQTQHILMSKSYSCVTKRNSTVMVIIKLKTILNEKVGYRFCQEISGVVLQK